MFLIWYSHVVHMVSDSSLRNILKLPSSPNFNGLYGALVRIKDVAYLPCIYYKVKAWIQ
jgi:hypothetical protein